MIIVKSIFWSHQRSIWCTYNYDKHLQLTMNHPIITRQPWMSKLELGLF